MNIFLWCGNIVSQCKRAKRVFDMDRLLRLCEHQIEGREDFRREIRKRAKSISLNIADYRAQELNVDYILNLSQCALKAPFDGESRGSCAAKLDLTAHDAQEHALYRSRT